ncbi:MAG TPA: DUF3786 domain-containing protein, partial [Thermodesulfobacteriota bacterium]|nr:DUF3786 domain-containing protein [Thermodesulfobacteriota bacterium]
NCKDCGQPTCMAFAGLVISDKLELKNCPHLTQEVVETIQREIDEQHSKGIGTRKDLAQEALQWAQERAASMRLEDLPQRIGGDLKTEDKAFVLELPYFTGSVHIRQGEMAKADGSSLNRWEQVFLYNHMAQGGSRQPTGKWKGLEEFPNTVSKVKAMCDNVEDPLVDRFGGRIRELITAGLALGAVEAREAYPTADVALLFRPLPRIPVLLLFWDADESEGFEARVKLLFDETIMEHLDIESIIFLSERLRQLLCGGEE